MGPQVWGVGTPLRLKGEVRPKPHHWTRSGHAGSGRMDCDAPEAEVDSRKDMQGDSPCEVPIPSTVTTATS